MKKQKGNYASAIAMNSVKACVYPGCTKVRSRLHRYCLEHMHKLIRYGSASGRMIPQDAYLSRFETEVERLVDLNSSKGIMLDTLDAIAGIRERVLMNPPSQPGVKQLDYFASCKKFDPKKILIHVACLHILLKEEPFLYPIFSDNHINHWYGFACLRTVPRERVPCKSRPSGYDVAWILTTKVWMGEQVWERAGRLILALYQAYKNSQKSNRKEIKQ